MAAERRAFHASSSSAAVTLLDSSGHVTEVFWNPESDLSSPATTSDNRGKVPATSGRAEQERDKGGALDAVRPPPPPNTACGNRLRRRWNKRSFLQLRRRRNRNVRVSGGRDKRAAEGGGGGGGGGAAVPVDAGTPSLARRGWHANVPSCRIYPGALGLLCEKTQSARGPLQLAPVGLPLSEPPEGGGGEAG